MNKGKGIAYFTFYYLCLRCKMQDARSIPSRSLHPLYFTLLYSTLIYLLSLYLTYLHHVDPHVYHAHNALIMAFNAASIPNPSTYLGNERFMPRFFLFYLRIGEE